MADTPKVYVICDQNCKFEGMTKEQILTAIIQAVNEGTIGNIDTGFITTIKTINGLPLKFFVGTESEYNALTDEQKNGLYAIITNDSTRENMEELLETVSKSLNELIEGLNTGKVVAAEAQVAVTLKSDWVDLGKKNIRFDEVIEGVTLECGKTYLVELISASYGGYTFIITVGTDRRSNAVLFGSLIHQYKIAYLETTISGVLYLCAFNFDGTEYTEGDYDFTVRYKELI